MQVELNRREGRVTARLVGELDHHGAGGKGASSRSTGTTPLNYRRDTQKEA